MSTIPASAKRHALGMPAGSVRTILALLVVLLVCSIILLPSSKELLPPYLIYLMFLIVGHFFAALGHAQAEHSRPLYMPRGLVQLIIIAALGATIAWKIYHDPENLAHKWAASVEAMKEQWFMPILLLGGFFVGVLVRMVVGRDNPPVMVQDFEAWVALIAVVALFISGIIHVIIEGIGGRPAPMPTWEGFVAAVIAFYFGARS